MATSPHNNNSSRDRLGEIFLDTLAGARSIFGVVTTRILRRQDPSSKHEGSALQSATLEEHVGFAGVAMPALPSDGKKGFYGRVALLAGVVILAFFTSFLGLSQLQNMRDQQSLRSEFRYTLANGTAPVSGLAPNQKLLTPGSPVALLHIPKLGINAVIVEGTSSDVTVRGPGHRRDTVLPGQVGVSVIYGRQFTYGATFNNIGSLEPGDTITAVTGQGESRFEVIGVRYTGDSLPEPPAADEGRLTLVSAAGIPLFPTGAVRVDAQLVGSAHITPLETLSYAALSENEEALRGNASAWPILALTLAFIFALVITFALLRRLWGTWQTWIVAIPVLLAVGSFAGLQVATLFPNLV